MDEKVKSPAENKLETVGLFADGQWMSLITSWRFSQHSFQLIFCWTFSSI